MIREIGFARQLIGWREYWVDVVELVRAEWALRLIEVESRDPDGGRNTPRIWLPGGELHLFLLP